MIIFFQNYLDIIFDPNIIITRIYVLKCSLQKIRHFEEDRLRNNDKYVNYNIYFPKIVK